MSLLNHQSRDSKLLSLTRRSSTALSWTSVLSTASNVAQSITWFGFSLVRNTTWSFNPWKLGGFLASCHLRSMDHRISLETFGKLSHVRTKLYVIFFTKANIINMVLIFKNKITFDVVWRYWIIPCLRMELLHYENLSPNPHLYYKMENICNLLPTSVSDSTLHPCMTKETF